MGRHSVLSTLLCVLLMTFYAFGSGCSSEKKDEPPESTRSTAGSAEAPLQDTHPAVQTVKAEQKKAPPAVVVPETEQKKATLVAEKPSAGSVNKTPPIEIVILSRLWQTHTKGAVKFTHEKHIRVHKISCSECHHIYKDGKNLWDKRMPAAKCETCHNELTVKGEKKLPPDLQKKNLKLAFHKNCRGCHKVIKKENPETKAPSKCNQCHEKKEQSELKAWKG